MLVQITLQDGREIPQTVFHLVREVFSAVSRFRLFREPPPRFRCDNNLFFALLLKFGDGLFASPVAVPVRRIYKIHTPWQCSVANDSSSDTFPQEAPIAHAPKANIRNLPARRSKRSILQKPLSESSRQIKIAVHDG
jgi:hypothetical protein